MRIDYDRLLYYLGIASLAVLLFVEPYVRTLNESLQVGMLTGVLGIWLALSITVIIPHYIRSSRNFFFLIGFWTIFVLVARALLSDEPVAELLPVSYSLIFICSAIIARQAQIGRQAYRRILLLLTFAALGATVHANLLAMGVVGAAQVPIGEMRFALTLDANAMIMALVIGVAMYSSQPTVPRACLAGTLSLLALLRLLSFGSKGPMVAALIILMVTGFRTASKKGRVLGALVVPVVLVGVVAVVSQLELMGSYLTLFIERFDNNDTWVARLDEAANDFNAFLDRPALGWGRRVPGFNLLGETSSGHITLTGMLGRIGLVGTIGLTLYYFGFFLERGAYVKACAETIAELRVTFSGVIMFVVFLVILGNPLFLFPPWAFLPLLLPNLEMDKRS